MNDTANELQVVSRDEWVVARKQLLAHEKELTRRRDAVSAERRSLPMVAIDKEYVFEGPDGNAGLWTCSMAAASYSSGISCSTRTGKRAARRAR